MPGGWGREPGSAVPEPPVSGGPFPSRSPATGDAACPAGGRGETHPRVKKKKGAGKQLRGATLTQDVPDERHDEDDDVAGDQRPFVLLGVQILLPKVAQELLVVVVGGRA